VLRNMPLLSLLVRRSRVAGSGAEPPAGAPQTMA
jgi:hypothetical protein